jgi:predicted transcriptional regulator
MKERRETGGLESEVLATLWALGEPATPAAVRQALDTSLAYTTIMTILVRLWQKGLVEREKVGKAYTYFPRVSDAHLTAERMHVQLETSSDKRAVLAEFVGTLTPSEEHLLRQLIEDSES